jgi:O-antigen/teichoic acid export membrane protein
MSIDSPSAGPAQLRHLPHAFKWARLLTSTGLWQASVAAVGFASGIVVVRMLDVEQYAVYTIANSLLGALIVIGDSGISTSVMAQGGRVWLDQQRLGSVVCAALRMCWFFAVAAALVAVPASLYLLGKHGATTMASLGIALLLIPCFAISVRNNILQIPLRLHQDLTVLQKIQLATNVVRLALLGGVLLAFSYAWAAILAAAGATLFANVALLRRGRRYTDQNAAYDPCVRKEMLRIVGRSLPGSIYYCVLGQVTIWLISVFGNTQAVAQLGALGRLGMITSVVTSVVAILVVPRFARLTNERGLLLRRLGIISAALILVCVFGVGFVALFPSPLLWVLGASYAHLHDQLLLVAISSAFSLAHGICGALAFSRGLIPNPMVLIPFSILTQALFIVINDVSTLNGVLLVGVGASACMFVFYASYLYRAASRLPR